MAGINTKKTNNTKKGKKKAEVFIPGQRVYFIKRDFIYPGTYVGKRYDWHEVLAIIGRKQIASFKLHKVYGTYEDAEKIVNTAYRKESRKRYGHAPKEIREYVEEEIKAIRLKRKGNDFIPDEDLF